MKRLMRAAVVCNKYRPELREPEQELVFLVRQDQEEELDHFEKNKRRM